MNKLLIPIITILILAAGIGGYFVFQKFVFPTLQPANTEKINKETTVGKLLPDLPQQLLSSEFIYSIWLGRGLYTNEELDRGFRAVRNLGIKYFMVEFKWSYIEPKNNQWQWNNEETLDVERVVKLAKQYNLSIIPYFDIFMPWGEVKYPDPKKGECEGMGSGRGQHQAPAPEEYAEYVFTVVDKLKKGGVDVKYIELDNEDSNQNDGYQGWSCFLNATAKQIKEAENAAYDKVKSTYPKIMISSTTFGFPGLSCIPKDAPIKQKGPDCEIDKERRNSFVKAYFEDEPKPKFDFLGVHEVFGGSGSPYTTWEKSANTTYEYNFGSYNDAYDMWREILDKYGYTNTPIFNLESGAIRKGMQDAELIQRAVFARSNSDKNKVMGWVLSQLTGSKAFTEAQNKQTSFATIGITRLREGYYGYYSLMNILANYPNYDEKIMGELNSQKPWVEKFSNDKGNLLYVAFIPLSPAKQSGPQVINLEVGANKEVKITKSDTPTSTMKSDSNGYITLEINAHPVFIEAQ